MLKRNRSFSSNTAPCHFNHNWNLKWVIALSFWHSVILHSPCQYIFVSFKHCIFRKSSSTQKTRITAIAPLLLRFVFFSFSCVVTKSCPTLCNPMDCSLPGSSAHGIFQARILEWIVISFFKQSSWPRHWTHGSYACTCRRVLYHRATQGLSYPWSTKVWKYQKENSRNKQ